MKQIAMQNINGQPKLFSKEDQEKWSGFKENQVMIAKVSGTRKTRSLSQLRLFFACCRAISENTEDTNWDNVYKVENQVKVELQFIDMEKSCVIGNKVFPHYRSISFAELEFMEANNFFDRAFKFLAKVSGVSIDELLENSERSYT